MIRRSAGTSGWTSHRRGRRSFRAARISSQPAVTGSGSAATIARTCWMSAAASTVQRSSARGTGAGGWPSRNRSGWRWMNGVTCSRVGPVGLVGRGPQRRRASPRRRAHRGSPHEGVRRVVGTAGTVQGDAGRTSAGSIRGQSAVSRTTVGRMRSRARAKRARTSCSGPRTQADAVASAKSATGSSRPGRRWRRRPRRRQGGEAGAWRPSIGAAAQIGQHLPRQPGGAGAGLDDDEGRHAERPRISSARRSDAEPWPPSTGRSSAPRPTRGSAWAAAS